jgi:cobalt-zinc-cadmium efflux system outer membrane protein
MAVRMAYYDVLTARREVEENEKIVKIAQEGLAVARKLQKVGIGGLPDILRAEVELDQSRIRLGIAQQRAAAAWKVLLVAVGLPDQPPGSLAGRLEGDVPRYQWPSALVNLLARSSEIQEAQAAILQAEGQLRMAQAQTIPNVQVRVRPFYVFPDDDTQVNVEAGIMLPIFDRNQGNILAAQAEVARLTEAARQVQLRLTERLAAAFQRYENARQQAELYEERIVPKAEESLHLVLIGYQQGDVKYDYTAVLEAQRTLIQARLARVQALGELRRAVSEIEGLLQVEPSSPERPIKNYSK